MTTETVYITPRYDLRTGTTTVHEITWTDDRQRKAGLCAELAAAIGAGGPFDLDVGAVTEGRTEFVATRGEQVAATVVLAAAKPAPVAPPAEQDTTVEITAEGLPIGDPFEAPTN